MASTAGQGIKLCTICGDVYRERESHCHNDGAALVPWDASAGDMDQRRTSVLVADQPPMLARGTVVAKSISDDGAARSVVLPSAARKARARALGKRTQNRALRAPHPGTVLCNRFRLRRQIGVGGFGAVFDAVDDRLKRQVAVKILSPVLSADQAALARFHQEAIAASQVRHEAIIDVRDYDADPDGTHFIVMEFLDGVDLAAVLESSGPLEPQRALTIATRAASGLAAAHRAGILHRDLKPANIFLTRGRGGGELVKLLDFGVSKVTRKHSWVRDLTLPHIAIGTPAYAAPEQSHIDGVVDQRADIYALGVVLYEILVGEKPFVAETARGYSELHAHARVVPPSQARRQLARYPGLDAVVLRALQKRPENRYQTMAEFERALIQQLGAIAPEQTARLNASPSKRPAVPAERAVAAAAEPVGPARPHRLRRTSALAVVLGLAVAASLIWQVTHSSTPGNLPRATPELSLATASVATAIRTDVPRTRSGAAARTARPTAAPRKRPAPATTDLSGFRALNELLPASKSQQRSPVNARRSPDRARATDATSPPQPAPPGPRTGGAGSQSPGTQPSLPSRTTAEPAWAKPARNKGRAGKADQVDLARPGVKEW
jgi:eukaryotic-like serine/threonine-protein kinase